MLEQNLTGQQFGQDQEDLVKKQLEIFEKYTKSIFVDSNTVEEACIAVKKYETLESLVEAESGKSVYHKLWQEANEFCKKLLQSGEEARKLLRQKIYNWLDLGNKNKNCYLKKGSLEVVVIDPDTVPDEWWKIDEDKIKEEAKLLDGKLEIPGVLIKKTKVLVIRLKDGKEEIENVF